MCCFVATMHLFSRSLSIVLRCGGPLLNAIFCFSSAMCIRWPGFALIRLSCRCVIDVMFLHCVCCKRIIWTRIMVCSVSFHLLLSEFDIPRAAAAAHPLEFEVSWCKTSQFARRFLPVLTRVWNDLPYTVFDTGSLDGFKGAVNHWLLPWVCFSVFTWRRCLWGRVSNLLKKCFPIGACAAWL